MFFAIACISAYLVFAEAPSLKVASLLLLVAWASARFYYFLFYVLERYVDPTMRYSGIFNLVATIAKRSKERGGSGA